jgi:hypothetical protein
VLLRLFLVALVRQMLVVAALVEQPERLETTRHSQSAVAQIR